MEELMAAAVECLKHSELCIRKRDQLCIAIRKAEAGDPDHQLDVAVRRAQSDLAWFHANMSEPRAKELAREVERAKLEHGGDAKKVRKAAAKLRTKRGKERHGDVGFGLTADNDGDTKRQIMALNMAEEQLSQGELF